MKRLLMTLTITGLISFLFGNYIFGVYKNNLEDAIKGVTNIFDDIYMLQYGSYNNIDKAKNNNLDNYILEKEDKYYKVYIGVTYSKESAEKIKEIYKQSGKEIYIKEKQITDLEFIDYLYSYEDKLLNGNKDEVINIQNNIIDKYKEIILDE